MLLGWVPRTARLTSYNVGAAIVVTMLCNVLQWSHAKSVDVGGTAGWTSFETGQVTAPNYGAWASTQKFYIGDSLVFKFAAGAHNVWKLQSRAAFQSCDFSGATLLDAGDSGFYVWKATQLGEHYFSCDKGAEGVGTHCNYNQKLAIIVSKPATTPTSAPSPSPPIPNTPPPSPLPLPHPPSVSPAPSLPPTKPPLLAPIPGPWHSPAPAPFHSSPPTKPPVLAPSSLPVPASPAPAPFPSLPPTKPPVLAPVSSPVPGPWHSPAPAPSPTQSPTITPVPAPSISSLPAPAAHAPSPSSPSPSSPDSSPPNPNLPDVPGGEPTALISPSQNSGVLLSAQSSPCLLSALVVAIVLLW